MKFFPQVKNIFNNGPKPAISQLPIIYRLETVYSTVFIAFSVIFAVLLALLLGIKVSNGLVFTIAIGIGILFIYSVLRYESTNDVKECLQPHFSLIVTWFLLVNFGFYATSHQPTISQIDWSPAFVGRTANFDNSNVISAILVLLSTFSSYFLLLTVYPLLVIFPFMLYAIYPKLSMKVAPTNADDAETNIDMSSGEINLFEHEKLFMASAFKVGCQLIILQGFKALASMIACTILCRHLMVWKIFAPRFIYEGIATYASFVAIAIGFMILMRIQTSVKSLVEKINKKFDFFSK